MLCSSMPFFGLTLAFAATVHSKSEMVIMELAV